METYTIPLRPVVAMHSSWMCDEVVVVMTDGDRTSKFVINKNDIENDVTTYQCTPL